MKDYTLMTKERKEIIFNALKKALDSGFSSLSTYGISSFDLGIEDNCFLLNHKRKLYISN